jgi:hypothetical protein
VGNDSLRPGLRSFALVKRHHQLPQVRLGARSKTLEFTSIKAKGNFIVFLCEKSEGECLCSKNTCVCSKLTSSKSSSLLQETTVVPGTRVVTGDTSTATSLKDTTRSGEDMVVQFM